MSRDWRLYFEDIKEAGSKVIRYTNGIDAASFLQAELVRDAVIRNLEVIGEAAKRLPPEVRARYPSVEWRKIAGFRDIVAHAYFAIDDAILADVVFNKVPEPIAALGRSPDAPESRERK